MHRSPALVVGALVAVCASSACGDRLVDASYEGDPLATLRGTVTNPLSLSLDDEAKVWLYWRPSEASGVTSLQEAFDLGYVVGADVEADFPSSFVLDVMEVPPAGAIHTVTGADGGTAQIAGAEIAVMTDAQLLDLVTTGTVSGVVGTAKSALLFIPEGSALTVLATTTALDLQEGFNLTGRSEEGAQCVEGEEAEYEGCLAGCADDDGGCFDACAAGFDIFACPMPTKRVPLDTPIEIELFDVDAADEEG